MTRAEKYEFLMFSTDKRKRRNQNREAHRALIKVPEFEEIAKWHLKQAKQNT